MTPTSIRSKIVATVAASLALALFPILYVSSVTHRKNLLATSEKTLSTNAAALGNAVRNLMLEGQAPAAVRVLAGLKNVQALRGVEIYRTDGSAAFRDAESGDGVDMIGNARFQSVLESRAPRSAVLSGTREMEYYFPILNLPECGRCHGTDQSVRGVVYLRLSTERVRERVVESAVILAIVYIAAGIFIVLVPLFFLNRGALRPLLAIGGAAKAGERRKLAILFCVVKRFNRFAAENAPQQVIGTLGAILQSQAELVGRYGGKVDRFVGNAVTALFDDGYSAVRCAYQIVRSAVALERERGNGLLAGIGVSEGQVVLGSITTPDRPENATVGDAVDLAARLGRLAKANMIIVSEDLAASLGGRVRARLIQGKKAGEAVEKAKFFVLEGVLDQETGRWLK